MTQIITEIGVNWCGDLDIARGMIFQSKKAGADCVKFQMFDESIIKGSKYESELQTQIIDYSILKELVTCARQNGIKIGVSTMYEAAFDIIEDLSETQEERQVDFIKIRCCDSCDSKAEPIIRKAVSHCDEYSIPLLVSTEKYVGHQDFFKYNLYKSTHVNYLYCVPIYPPELKDIYYSRIVSDNFDGYSNHYPDLSIPAIAIAAQKEWLEVHVKRTTHNSVARSLNLVAEQIDEPVSISFVELQLLCNMNKTIQQLGV